MRLGLMLAIALVSACTASAEPRNYSFTWSGENGYWLHGAIGFDSADAVSGIIREWDVTCFEIKGFRTDDFLGRWALGELTAKTAWRVHFDLNSEAFLVVGDGYDMPQAWNMRGDGNGCGAGGFGFNLGNLAQDICVDDAVVIESQTGSFQPFPATRDDEYWFPPDACYGPSFLSLLDLGGEGPILR